MSVQVNTYIAFGVLLPFDTLSEDDYDKYEPYMDSAFKGIHHHNGLCVIRDGMNGKYVIIGRVLAKSKVYENFDSPMTPNVTPTEIELVGSLITSQFGIENPEVKLWIFSHYR